MQFPCEEHILPYSSECNSGCSRRVAECLAIDLDLLQSPHEARFSPDSADLGSDAKDLEVDLGIARSGSRSKRRIGTDARIATMFATRWRTEWLRANTLIPDGNSRENKHSWADIAAYGLKPPPI